MSGTVVNQNAKPINNATVQVIGVDYDQLTPSASETKDQLANTEFTDVLNKTPQLWEDQQDENFELLGPSGHFNDVETTYVAVHERSDWARGDFGTNLRDPPELDQPLLTSGLQGGETRTVALSIWDPGEEQSDVLENDVDEQLPGKPTTGRVTIETLLAKDAAFETTTARVRFDEGGALGNLPGFNIRGTPEEYNNAFVLVDVTPGFYKVYPEDNPDTAYVVQIGDPITLIWEDVKNADGNVADQAQRFSDKLNDGLFTRTTTTTSSNGSWSVDVGSSVNRVEVQAYKAPSVKENATDLTVAEILEEYDDADEETLNDLGSVYLPSQTRRVSPPESDVEIELREITYPPYGNLSKLEDKLKQDLFEQLNESIMEEYGFLQDNTSQVNREDLEELHDDVQELVEENNQLEDRVRELLEEDEDEAVEVIVNSSDLSRDELESRIEELQTAFDQLEDSIEAGDPIASSGQQTVSLSFPFDAELESENVLVLAHWSNGTTDRLDTSSEHVFIDSRLGRGDVVRIDEYPVGDADANAVNFEVLVSTPAGVGSASEGVVNPTFGNDVPELKSVSLTSLRPGPGEKVDIEVHPEDESIFDSLTAVTVNGPEGESITTDAIGADGRTTGFTPSKEGVHRIELQFNNTDGDQFTEVFRIRAASTDRARSAGVQPRSGTTGLFVLVGDGIDNGNVEANADGSQVTLSAQIDSGDSVPGSVHFYAEELDGASRTEYTLRVVKGDSEQSVSRSVGVVLHSPSITSEDPVIYRQANQPIPRDGTNPNGQTQNRANGTVIRTFTEADGAVRVTIDNDPGLVARGFYRGRLLVQGAPVVGSGVITPPGETWRIAADVAGLISVPYDFGGTPPEVVIR